MTANVRWQCLERLLGSPQPLGKFDVVVADLFDPFPKFSDLLALLLDAVPSRSIDQTMFIADRA